MKELVILLSNQGVNYDVIWTDILPFLFFAALLVVLILLLFVKWLREDLMKASNDMAFELARIDKINSEKFALRVIKTRLEEENASLKDKLEKYNFPRNEKGKFVSKKSQIKATEHV